MFTGAWCSPSDTSQSILRPHCRGYRPSSPHYCSNSFYILAAEGWCRPCTVGQQLHTVKCWLCNAWRHLRRRPLWDAPRKPTAGKALSMCPVAGIDGPTVLCTYCVMHLQCYALTVLYTYSVMHLQCYALTVLYTYSVMHLQCYALTELYTYTI